MTSETLGRRNAAHGAEHRARPGTPEPAVFYGPA